MVLPVTVDGQTIGAVAPASYLFVDRAPGPHTVGIEGKGIFGTSKFEANIQTTAGGAYYYLLAVDDRPPGTGPGYSMLLRIASANAGERLEGRGNSGMRLYSLDADVGAAEIAKLRPARTH